MHNATERLDVFDIYKSAGVAGDAHTANITRSLIADAIKRIHGVAVGEVFQDDNTVSYPVMPTFELLPPRKTQFWQFGSIHHDEGSIEGTYGVHESIFLDQLGLRAQENPSEPGSDDFLARLWLVHGDQLTAHHIRSVKRDQARALRPYDRRSWMLGVPSWFHIQMNLLNTILQTHWAAPSTKEEAHHTIQADITLWGRSQSSREKAKYHQMEPLVAQGFTARVTALFYDAMQRGGFLLIGTGGPQDLRIVSAAIALLTPAQFIALVDEVYDVAFTLPAWKGQSATGRHDDLEFRTMCRYLQEVGLFLTVRHAVKHADIGLLRRLVDPLIVCFFGASQHNYGYEMLYYRWNLSRTNALVLQRAILASGIVNWPGRANTYKAIDLMLEHLNCACKIEMKSYKNSTHDIDTIFNRVCLCNTWTRALRRRMEDSFGEYMPGAHTVAEVVPAMFLLACKILKDGLASPRGQEDLANYAGFFDSYDIFSAGMEVLAEKVDNFNATLDGVSSSVVEGSDSAIHIDIDGVEERTDNMLDPTTSIGPVDSLDQFG